ncbi:MAG: helix-turn-helix domain-containing protein [Cyclobacteriaceae bacterium]|nr:helix-turn-helix domain-containing protein [Cyclobacteriaceae bacterium]
MKHISILVPKGAVALGCIEGPFILFNKANEFMQTMGKPAMFHVQLVGLDREPQVYARFFTVTPDCALVDVDKTDLVIVPAVNGDMKQVIDDNKDFFPWIVQQHKQGSEVASLCVGAFLLASTGLLRGKECSTHWMAVKEFAEMFPDVQLVSDKIITDEQGIYSSGGANSFWNLLLYLLEKYTDREMAILFSKYYAIEIDRFTQSPFIMFQGQKEHTDEVIKKAQDFIEHNFQERITVEQLASMLALGRRNLERRFKKATSNSVVEYMQRVKIEAAKKSLETSSENVNEVMYRVGYTDSKAFRNTFKRYTGLSPVQYRSKYNRALATA